MLPDWFREYRDAVAPRWLRWVLALATIVGGVAGAYYLAREAGVSPLLTSLVVLLVASLILNVRQAVVWKRKHQTVKDTADTKELWRTQSERWKQRYEEEEQAGWTPSGLTYSHEELPATRMDKPHGVQVRVSSNQPIESPIRLRFWFSGQPGENALAWFHRDSAKVSSKEFEEGLASGAASISVRGRGRVDLEWTAGDTLNDRSQIVLVAYASEPGVSISLRSVERRYRLV